MANIIYVVIIYIYICIFYIYIYIHIDVHIWFNIDIGMYWKHHLPTTTVGGFIFVGSHQPWPWNTLQGTITHISPTDQLALLSPDDVSLSDPKHGINSSGGFSKYILSLNRPFGTQLFTKSISKLFLSWHRGSIGWGFSNEIWQTFLVPWQQVDTKILHQGKWRLHKSFGKTIQGPIGLTLYRPLEGSAQKAAGKLGDHIFLGKQLPIRGCQSVYLQNLATSGVKCRSYPRVIQLGRWFCD